MAKKASNMEEEIIDLTDLIEPGNSGSGNSGGRAAAAYAKAQTAPAHEEDDFESILAQTTPPARDEDSQETLDMSGMGDIDDIMASLDMPAQPKSASPAQPPDADDLDNVLDDLLGDSGPGKPKPNSSDDLDSSLDDMLAEKPDKKSSPNDAIDLDSFLDEPVSKPAPKAAKAAPETPAGGMDADLDDILASFDEPATPKPAPKPAAKAAPEPASMPDLDADLDDILAEMEPPKPASPPPAPEPEVAPTAPAADLDSGLDSIFAEAVPEPQKKSSPPKSSAADAGKSMENMAADDILQPARQPVEPEMDFDEELDAMLEEKTAVKPPRQAEAASPAFDLQELGESNESTSKLQAATLPLPENAADSSKAPVPVQTWSPDVLAGLCRNLTSGNQETLQEFSRELGAQSAHVEDMGDQLSQLGKRLLACESKLAASRARIASLEKGLESTAALEDLLREGTPLHAGFMALISAAVSNALKGFTPSASGEGDPELANHINKLEARACDIEGRLAALEKQLANQDSPAEMRAGLEQLDADVGKTDARLAALEKKVENLSQKFGQGLDKAASAAAAKVLHEEILKLLDQS